MNDLIKALNIFLKYGDKRNPTDCFRDTFAVIVDPCAVSQEDKDELEKLGFIESEEDECFISFRFGSC